MKSARVGLTVLVSYNDSYLCSHDVTILYCTPDITRCICSHQLIHELSTSVPVSYSIYVVAINYNTVICACQLEHNASFHHADRHRSLISLMHTPQIKTHTSNLCALYRFMPLRRIQTHPTKFCVLHQIDSGALYRFMRTPRDVCTEIHVTAYNNHLIYMSWGVMCKTDVRTYSVRRLQTQCVRRVRTSCVTKCANIICQKGANIVCQKGAKVITRNY